MRGEVGCLVRQYRTSCNLMAPGYEPRLQDGGAAVTETFKSGQWRICSLCLGSIKPKDRACFLFDEIACMACLTAEEEKAVAEHSQLSEELDSPSEETEDDGDSQEHA